jgi:hypothetical protein
MNEGLQQLLKALEAGSQNAAPSTLAQGSALQTEDLSPVMENVTFEEKHIKIQKGMSVKDAKSTLVQFNRQLSYGIFGGSAQYEGGLGEEDTSDFVRAVVPMAYYSTTRRVTVAANMVSDFDGVKAEDRAQEDAAKKLAADIEFDIIQGNSHFSNVGVFDGNPIAQAQIPNMVGFDQQIRQSDDLANTQDLMFAEYGSDQSVVLAANGSLNQSIMEDAAVRSAMNMGAADTLYLDPISLAAYNKIAHVKERIVLAGSQQEASGAQLRTQWTSSGAIALEPSRFMSGKTRPARSRAGSPAAPAAPTPAALLAQSSLLEAGDYVYYVTAVNERGESAASASASHTVASDGDAVNLTITAVSGAKYYNVYRSEAGGSAASAKFIGRIRQGASNPVFRDLGNKSPGFVTAYLLQKDTMDLRQLAPFSRLKLAVSELSLPEASFRFVCCAVKQPRKNVIIDNLKGQLS